jgi:hypothetical protein
LLALCLKCEVRRLLLVSWQLCICSYCPHLEAASSICDPKEHSICWQGKHLS